MIAKTFIDTNILIYAMDNKNKEKKNKAREILKGLQEEKNGVISTQIIQEFYVVATKKLSIQPLLVKSIIHSLNNFEVVTVNHPLIEEAIDCSILNEVSFWDGLVIVSAELSKCAYLLSEDLNHGQIIRNVKIANPFSG